MQRRDFLRTTAGAGAAWALAPHARLLGQPRTPAVARLDRIGLELYAVRKAMKADPDRTLAAVRAMGYTDVELLWSFNNFGQTKEQVRAALDREGLKASSCHMAPDLLRTDWERHLETAHFLGQEYLTVPNLPTQDAKTLDGWKRWADVFNTAGAAARRAGLWLAFHNEPTDQALVEGQRPLDVFVQALDPAAVRLQLDVGNMLLGGGDPMAFLARHRDRCWSFHLKNVTADHAHDTELQAGVFDLRAFLAAVPQLAQKRCFVEQEGPADELDSARQNFTFLRGLTF